MHNSCRRSHRRSTDQSRRTKRGSTNMLIICNELTWMWNEWKCYCQRKLTGESGLERWTCVGQRSCWRCEVFAAGAEAAGRQCRARRFISKVPLKIFSQGREEKLWSLLKHDLPPFLTLTISISENVWKVKISWFSFLEHVTLTSL